jgi:hypothetical protein
VIGPEDRRSNLLQNDKHMVMEHFLVHQFGRLWFIGFEPVAMRASAAPQIHCSKLWNGVRWGSGDYVKAMSFIFRGDAEQYLADHENVLQDSVG